MTFDTSFDGYLDRFEIYSKFPELKPAIGKFFSSRKNKIVIVGESHYLPYDSKIHMYSSEWYESTANDLTEIEREWINIRRTLSKWLNGSAKSKAYSIYNNLRLAANEIDGFIEEGESIFDYVTFMNYFLRPAKAGISIDRDNLDKQMAFENLISFCELTNADNIIFVSRISFWDFEWYLKNYSTDNTQLRIESIPHPSSRWWHSESNNYKDSNNKVVTGKQLFIEKLMDLNGRGE